ncbi:MAG: hypothetical protein GQ574_28740 [Crocinitomix sp.]|nr:hypothetical protein [Crocinitomix sp.]
MNLPPINTIDDVIQQLDIIIASSEKTNNPLGYFAALYKKVTVKVKEGIADNYFEDGPRMEKLDVVFASRYLQAYFAFENNAAVTKSWEVAFDKSKKYWPILLQHLMIGINAHINLDLGIAAAEISKGKNLEDLKGDFDKINEVLSSLVADVEKDLSEIWPTLKKILKWTKSVDDFLIDFSMQLARDGAWKFAQEVFHSPPELLAQLIAERDTKVANNGKIIFPRNVIVRLVLAIIRIGERGTVAEKIKKLNG